MRIDAHQHFWQYNAAEHTWMNDTMKVIQQDFMPEHLEPLLSEGGFGGSIAVQARQSLKETDWLLDLADAHPFILGVIGWVNLSSKDIGHVLGRYRDRKKLVGVRHVVHDEPDKNFLRRSDIQRGIRSLQQFNLAYDLLIRPRHLPVALQLVDLFPEQRFVIDHMAKPDFKHRQIKQWQVGITKIAAYPNVFCKLSGMVTEMNWHNWSATAFDHCLSVVMEAFGADRVMIGSDWPVCTLSANYKETMSVVINFIKHLEISVVANILGGNCARFYQLTNNKVT